MNKKYSTFVIIGNNLILPGNFSGNKSFSSSWALVVEKDAITCEHAVGLTVIDHHPVSVELGYAIWRPS